MAYESIVDVLNDLFGFGENGGKEINLEIIEDGFKLIVDKKVELWFFKKGNSYYYDGWQINLKPIRG